MSAVYSRLQHYFTACSIQNGGRKEIQNSVIEGEIEVGLKPYFLAFKAAREGREDLMEKYLKSFRSKVPLGIIVNYRQRFKEIKETGYLKAAARHKEDVWSYLTRADMNKARDSYAKLKHCCEHLNDAVLDKDVAYLAEQFNPRLGI